MNQMSLTKLKRKHSGFTLVELLVVLTILAVIISIGYQLTSFGQNTFTRGEDQYISQENVRFSAELITRELRNAKEVTILPAIPATFDSSKRYIYIHDGKLKHYLGGGTIIDALDSIDDDAEFESLAFGKNSSSSSILSFSIKAKSGASHFEADSEVKILNLPESGMIDDSQLVSLGSSLGPVICYSYAESEKSLTLFALKIEHNTTLSESFEIINPANSFTCWVPRGTNKSKLIPYFEYIGKSVKVNGITQIPGVTENNFNSPLIYTVVAEDGSTLDYTVSVQEIPSRPEASSVKIEVINENINEKTPFEDSTLHGDYLYLENGCGPEGSSIYLWESSPTEDFTVPTIIASTRDIIPNGKAGLWVRFGVKPVSASGIPADRFYYSNPKLVYPAIDDNPFWRSFINDLYVSGLPASEQPRDFVSSVLYRTRYKAVSNLSPDKDNFNLTMSYDRAAEGISDGGSHIYKDLNGYVKDMESYSITIDAQVKAGSGYGILLYGSIKNNSSTDMNVDNGYMFQFDPGWNGFLMRKIENGRHSPWYRSFGLIKNRNNYDIGDYESFYYDYMKYTPQDIRNKFFRWSTDDTYQEISQWQKRYKTEIVIQRQLDKSIIYKVTVIDENDNISNEMWFGNFSPYNMDRYDRNGNFMNSFTSIKQSNLPSFATQGTYLGLRTWDKDSSGYKTAFQEIKLGDGFSMKIQEAEFISPTQIKVKMDQPLRNTFDLSKIKVKNDTVTKAETKVSTDEGELLILTLGTSASVNDLKSGSAKGLTLERGGVKQLMAGDVKVTNGIDFDISRDRTSPEVLSVTRNGRVLTVTFNEEINESTARSLYQYSIRQNNGSTLQNPEDVSVASNKKEVKLTFSRNIGSYNRITLSDVEDLAGNKMLKVENKEF